jgi:hypothetical protein
MKTKLKQIAFYTLAVLLGGCVQSLHPLLTEKDWIFDANLVGTWMSKDSNECWEFSSEDNKTYTFVYTDSEGKSGDFNAWLGKLDGYTFLDIWPKPLDLDASDFYESHFLKSHSFMMVEAITPQLKLRQIDRDRVDKLLENDPNIIKHERIEDGYIVLTASTEELQEFVLNYGVNEELGLFGEAAVLYRTADDATTGCQ